MIQNPILPGFHPDPSILRVNEDYYLATSTFEWFPGVMIYHSKDLVNWRLIARPLNRVSQLDMRGNADSGGIWAPCLTWDDGLFYLCYTDMKNWRDVFNYKDAHNYLVTAPEITGPWSEPIHMNSGGFDPSLFHDDDGRKWFSNIIWDYRGRDIKEYFGGIILQEYDPGEKRLTGPVKTIFKGTPIGLTEGPHIYKRNGFYYLMTAEGGTEYEHAVTMARSKSIDGPYEIDPQTPMLTSANNPELVLQKAGHASLVETQTGEWYLAHLCGRPVGAERRCILGRETAIQKCYWNDDGWLRLTGGGNEPRASVEHPDLPAVPFAQPLARDDFDRSELDLIYQTLRIPADDSWLSLVERPGWLRLRGQETLSSRHRQSLVTRRVQHFYCEASTRLEFNPETFQHMAGLTAFYDTTCHYYLFISHDERLGKVLNLFEMDQNEMRFCLKEPVELDEGPISLKVVFSKEILQFWYAPNDEQWQKVGPALDATKLSDDYGELTFTGAFVGLCAQDLSGHGKHADFDWFEYSERTGD